MKHFLVISRGKVSQEKSPDVSENKKNVQGLLFPLDVSRSGVTAELTYKSPPPVSHQNLMFLVSGPLATAAAQMWSWSNNVVSDPVPLREPRSHAARSFVVVLFLMSGMEEGGGFPGGHCTYESLPGVSTVRSAFLFLN